MAVKTKPRQVGRRIRELRLALGLSQRDVGAPGTSYAYISRIEHGSRSPSFEALIQIATMLGTTGLGLLTGNEHAPCPFCQRKDTP